MRSLSHEPSFVALQALISARHRDAAGYSEPRSRCSEPIRGELRSTPEVWKIHTVCWTEGLEDRVMPAHEKRTFSLPAEQARYIDSLVASGTYATASEVIRAGLRALQERDAAVERWLREEVVPVYDAMQADRGRAIPADQVRAALRARQAQRLKDGPRRSGGWYSRRKPRRTFSSATTTLPSIRGGAGARLHRADHGAWRWGRHRAEAASRR